VDEAMAYYLQDLKLTRSEVGVNHPRVARILGAIGMVYDDKTDKLAGELYESSLAMLLETYGSAHVDVATVRSVCVYSVLSCSQQSEMGLEMLIMLFFL
jgi:hypothetical protein